MMARNDNSVSDADRVQLSLDNFGLVLSTAGRIARAYGGRMDELISSASYGLVLAANRFDPRLGSFGPYAIKCVRGTVINDLRTEWRRASHMVAADAQVLDVDTLLDSLAAPMDSAQSVKDDVASALKVLSGRRLEIIKALYGIDTRKETVAELAKRFGVTRMCIYNNERVALEKMRRALKKRKWVDQSSWREVGA